jgi:hypothetical protein
MATLTLRLVKGSTLTFSETDNNFTALNDEKIERDGSIPFTGAQRFIAGTVSAPGITIVGDTNTGIYSPAADQLAITCGGTQRGLFSSSGLTITGSSGVALTVNGVATQYAASFNGGTAASGDISGINVSGSTPNYVVSRFSNSNTSGSTSIEVVEGSGTARAFVSANSGTAGFGSNTSVPVHIYSNSASRITISTGGNVTINAPSSGTALAINGVATQYAASFNGGTAGSGDLLGIDVYGSTPGYVVSRLRNTHASGYTSVEVIGGNGASSSFIAAHPTKAVFGSNTNTQVEIWSNNSSRIAVTGTGNVYISAPSSGTTLYVYGDIYATGTITQGSDARLKTNIHTINSALDKVSAIRGVSFTRTDTGKRDIGVIAQEVAEVIPEVVHEVEDGNLGVAYGSMVGILIEALKELRNEVEAIRTEVLQLKAKF